MAQPSHKLALVLSGLFGLFLLGTGVLVLAGLRENLGRADVALVLPPESVNNDGTTTFASARNAARIARERRLKSILVVSQYFHLPRARLALRRSGFTTEAVGYLSYLLRAANPMPVR